MYYARQEKKVDEHMVVEGIYRAEPHVSNNDNHEGGASFKLILSDYSIQIRCLQLGTPLIQVIINSIRHFNNNYL